MLNLNGEPVREMIGTRPVDSDQPLFAHRALEIEIRERILDLRASKKWTQEEMASALGLSLSALRRLEQGRQAWTLEQIDTVAKHFGVPALSIFEGRASAAQPAIATAVERGDPVRALRALADALEAAPGPELDPTARRLLSAYQAKDWPALMRLCADLAERWGIDR